MRLSRLFKREGAVDNRPEAAVEQKRQDFSLDRIREHALGRDGSRRNVEPA